jgi:hypothetical protein
MTDPIERLRSFDPGDPVTPATPADVRRRGEQIRRRRQRMLVAAAAVSAAAVVLPAAVLGISGGGLPPAAPAISTPAMPPPSPSDDGSAPTEPEPTTGVENSAAEPAPIPADFPLAAGWPDDSAAEPNPQFGLTPPGPALEHPVFDYPACDRALPIPTEIDQLRAMWANIEDLRSRQLLTFPDAGAAAAFVGGAADFYRACGVEPVGGDGLTYTWTVVPTGYGGQSVAASSTPSRDGEPAVGVVRMVHLIRLGSAVLIDTSEGEGGGGGPDLPGLTRSRAGTMAQAAAPVVAAMCRFTEAGC